MKNCYAIILFVYSHSVLLAQPLPNYPKYYFRNPLDIPMELTANMGELRPDHWHLGLDLRTQKKENLRVYASAGGYIAKIKIEPFGYGRSIFINHPNGMTTVYGHLNDFFPALEKYVTEQQYKKQSWEIELDFSKDQFPVFKSQLIAYSGNTGGSMGPHLHFEIRDTKTGKCLSPLLFGFPVEDNLPPEIIQLAVYDRSISVYQQNPQLFSLRKTAKAGYILSSAPVIRTGLKTVSFAIQAFDKMKKSGSRDGIYSAKIFLDNKPIISFVLDSISYDESVFVNAQVDYKYYYEKKTYLQHLSLLPGDPGIVYRKINGNGVINLKDTGFHLVHIEVRDEYNHRSQLNFEIQHIENPEQQVKPDTLKKFLPNRATVFQKPDFEFSLPENSLYDAVPVVYARSNSTFPNAISAAHQLNDPSVPLLVPAMVRIKPVGEIPENLRSKMVMLRSDERRNNIRKAEWQQGWVAAKFGDFGTFRAFVDTVAPQIKDIGKTDTVDYTSAKSIFVEVKDNFDVVKNFRGEIDGQWIRFTNDKTGPFVYDFDERCPYGVHQLKVTAEDLAGNTTTKTWWFKRNPYLVPPKKIIYQKKKTPSKQPVIYKTSKTK